jgi:arylsulfatase I/J
MPKPPKRPHLLYLLADDYGWANVGFHAADMHTPNIDRLAKKEGFELQRLYAYRFCSPTRSSLLTGRLPYHVNQLNNAAWGWNAPAVSTAMTLLPEKLQQAGYYTVHAGKW